MVCGEEVGWRNDTRKVVVFTTDQSFHVAMVSCNVRHNFYICKASQKYYVKNNNPRFLLLGRMLFQVLVSSIQNKLKKEWMILDPKSVHILTDYTFLGR